MMNVCESIQGALYDEAAEVVNTLWPKAMRVGKRLDSTFRGRRTLRTIVGI